MKFPHLDIFERFVILGIIVFVFLGIFLSSLVGPTLTNFILEQKELNSVVFINRLAAEHLSPEDFKQPAFRGESRERFERFISKLQEPGLFRVKIWNPDGVIVYSDEERWIGRQLPFSHGFVKALNLKTEAAFTVFDSTDPHVAYELPFIEALEVYAPVTFGASPEVIGVVETYARIGFLKQQIKETQQLFTIRIGVSLFIMFSVLSFIVWRASRTVKSQRSQLEGYATSLEKKVRERTQELETVTVQKLEQADQLARLKDDFVFIATHELRTPVKSIIANTEMLSADPLIKKLLKKSRESLENLSVVGKRLLELTNDLLDVARLESGTVKIKNRPLKLGHLVKDTVEEVRVLAEEHAVTITFDTSIENIDTSPVMGDERRLKEVVTNFLSNAIKYSDPKEGRVSVEVTEKGKEIVVSVSNNGPQISPENQKHVFEKFWRSKEAQKSAVKGTGLGLFIVKQLVEMMEGRTWFTSEKDTTTFYVALKKA